MNDPIVGLKTLIQNVRGIVRFLGAEALDRDRATELVYQDNRIYLLVDESTGKTWVAIPVWDEDQQECRWESVLDVPEANAVPEKFLTNVIPEGGDLAWTDYLGELESYAAQQFETSFGDVLLQERYRFIRRWIGVWSLDIDRWIREMGHLRDAGLNSAAIALNLMSAALKIPRALEEDLINLRVGYGVCREDREWNL